MSLDRYTTLHRKDERGVIVESKVFGPDDEIPEVFGTDGYSPIYAPREDDQEPIAESVLTPWSSPVAKGTWVQDRPEVDEVDEGSPEQVREELTEAEREALDALEENEDGEGDEPELDEGSPEQAREQAGEELTEAEQEALDAADSDEDGEPQVDETDAGTPVQATDTSDVPVPPQGGPGSGRDVWAAYAASKGVEVEAGDGRDEIIAACKAAGVPVD